MANHSHADTSDSDMKSLKTFGKSKVMAPENDHDPFVDIQGDGKTMPPENDHDPFVDIQGDGKTMPPENDLDPAKNSFCVISMLHSEIGSVIGSIEGAGKTMPKEDGLCSETGCSSKASTFYYRKAPEDVMPPRLVVQTSKTLSYSPPPALKTCHRADRVLSPEQTFKKKVFDRDGPTMPGGTVGPIPLYRGNVKQGLIVYSSVDACIKLAENADELIETTGVIVDQEAFISLKDNCGSEDWKTSTFMGKGAFGVVDSVDIGTRGRKFFRKKVSRNNFKKNEVALPCGSKHPNIVACVGLIVRLSSVDILLENAGLPLHEYMKLYPDVRKCTATIMNLFKQIINGLKYIHKYGHRHMDIKPGNLCVSDGQDGSAILKIIDFGSAKRSLEENDFKGLTPEYTAPEIWRFRSMKSKNEHISEKADMFSAGLVLLYMLKGTHVFRRVNQDISAVCKQICKMDISKSIPKNCPQDMQDLLENLLKKDPRDRWSALQAWNALQQYDSEPVRTQECEGWPNKTNRKVGKSSQKRKASNQMPSLSTDNSVVQDTAQVHLKDATTKPSGLRVSMFPVVVDIRERKVHNLPLGNIAVCGMVDKKPKPRIPAASCKKAKLDFDDTTERSTEKFIDLRHDGWQRKPVPALLSRSARPIEDIPALSGENMVAEEDAIHWLKEDPTAEGHSTRIEGTVADAEPIEGTVADAEPIEGTVADAEPIEGTVADAEPIEGTVADAEPIEGTVADAEPIEGTVADAEPIEGTVADARLIEGTVADARPIEGTVADARSIEGTVADARLKKGTVVEGNARKQPMDIKDENIIPDFSQLLSDMSI